MPNPNYTTVTVSTMPSSWTHPAPNEYAPTFVEPYRRVISLESPCGALQIPNVPLGKISSETYIVPTTFARRWTSFFQWYIMPFDAASQLMEETIASRYDCNIFVRHMCGEDTTPLQCFDLDLDGIIANWYQRNHVPRYATTVPILRQATLGDVGYLYSTTDAGHSFEHAFIDMGRSGTVLQVMNYGGYLALCSYGDLLTAYSQSRYVARGNEITYEFRRADPVINAMAC